MDRRPRLSESEQLKQSEMATNKTNDFRSLKGSLPEGAGDYTELRKQLHRSSRSESAVEGERVKIKKI